MKKKLVLLTLSALLLFSGCGAASSKNSQSISASPAENGYATDGLYFADDAYEEDYMYEENTADTASGTTSQENVRDGRKLIRTADLSVETLEFDKLLSYVKDRTNELGGYVENMNVNNGSGYDTYYSSQASGYRRDRSASLTLRIPKSNLDAFLGDVAENSNITSRSEQERDVTTSYVDLESHKKVLLTEQERLMTYLEQAESIEEMMTIESRLSDIRYQLESMESQLRTYDSQIEYSTVSLYISEVVELTPVETKEQTTWERISEGFLRSLRNVGRGFKEFFIGFVVALPYLLVTVLIVGVLFGIIYAIVKKSNAKHAKKMAERQSAYYRNMQAGGTAPSMTGQPAGSTATAMTGQPVQAPQNKQ